MSVNEQSSRYHKFGVDRAVVSTPDGDFSGREFVIDDVERTPLAFITDNGGQPNQFIDKARELVMEKYNRDLADLSTGDLITTDEIFVVWFSKVLQNWKALVSTDRSDGRYYELTYNGDKEETYVDVYFKTHNEVIWDEDR